MKEKILITGACGQIGSELSLALRERFGKDNVIASDIAEPSEKLKSSGPFHFVDCTNIEQIKEIVDRYDVETIYHLAAILSAAGEENPHL